MKTTVRGFTIVELLIVIVVIGILATLIIVAYSNIQSRAMALVADATLRDFSQRVQLFSTQAGGRFPVTPIELDTLEFKANTSNFATSPKVGSNILYCTANNGYDYAMLVYANNNKMYYITNTTSGEYSGSSNWNANNYGGRCSTILPGSASNSYSGYNVNNPGDGWADWTK